MGFVVKERKRERERDSLARSLAQGSTGSKGYSRRGRIFSFEELSDDFSSVCAGHVTGVKRGHVSARGRAR